VARAIFFFRVFGCSPVKPMSSDNALSNWALVKCPGNGSPLPGFDIAILPFLCDFSKALTAKRRP